MFSQTVEYALRAVVHLAYIAPNSCKTQELADATQVPSAYLSKVLQGLVKATIVKSQRGIGGGVSLLKSPSQLTILEVVNAVDPVPRITTCPLGLASHGTRLCPLHERMDNAAEAIEQQFRDVTLAEILEETSGSKPLCEDPKEVLTHLTFPGMPSDGNSPDSSPNDGKPKSEVD